MFRAVAEHVAAVVDLDLADGPAGTVDLEVPDGPPPVVEIVASGLVPAAAEKAAAEKAAAEKAAAEKAAAEKAAAEKAAAEKAAAEKAAAEKAARHGRRLPLGFQLTGDPAASCSAPRSRATPSIAAFSVNGWAGSEAIRLAVSREPSAVRAR
jgi:hypothetical protein